MSASKFPNRPNYQCDRERWAAFRADVAECLIARHMTLKECASALGVTEESAEWHAAEVKRKIRMQPVEAL